MVICGEEVQAYESERQGKSIEFKPISKRTLLYDIEFMKSEYPGFNAPIVNDRLDGYYYSDLQFELFKTRISKSDLEQFKSALEIIKKLSSKSQFKHLDSTIARMESTYNIRPGRMTSPMVQFEYSTNAEGQKWISEIIPFIKNKKTISLNYQPFDKDAYQRIVSPYLVKEFNNRWFLIAYDHSEQMVTNLGLERVKSLKASLQQFIPDEDEVSNNYSKDIIGVSIPQLSKIENIVFRANGILRHYIKTKPLHHTQDELEFTNEYGIFSIKVHINYELTSKLMQHKDNLEILEPEILRTELKRIVKNMQTMYS